MSMRITRVDLHTVQLPLVRPFTTSFKTETVREALLIELTADVDGATVTGWGECVAGSDPAYSSEYVSGSLEVIRRFLVPRLVTASDLSAETVAHHLSPVRGHPMSKAALQMAVLDAQLRAHGRSLAAYLGATAERVPSGVSVGVHDTIGELIDSVRSYIDTGYLRIKLKIKPGFDVEPVRAIRSEFGNELPLQVDANGAYTLSDARHLKHLDQFDLLLIEQPLGHDDLRQHAELARRLSTPICLDESITSVHSAVDAIALGAASIINIKAGRVGGYIEARKIHDIAQAHGVAVWCGGMLETGLGRAANAALAALPGFTLPGDISASDRFYARDITEPFIVEDGYIRVPSGPGLGVEPIPERVQEFAVAHATLPVDT